MQAARFVSFWTGFCSLSLEIAWVRLYAFANNSTPQALGFVLAVYLLGIALGAQLGKRACRLPERDAIARAGLYALALAAVFAVAMPWMYLHSRSASLDALAAPLGIMLTAGSLAFLFPITHHLGTPEHPLEQRDSKGKHFSRVYMLNVAGASLGPLVTGYVLLEHFTITQVFAILGCLIGLAALFAHRLFAIQAPFRLKAALWGLLLPPLGCLMLGISQPHAFVEGLADLGGGTVVAVHESRHGIIVIEKQDMKVPTKSPFVDHVVYGGNVYDGKVNTDLERNTNGLHRPLVTHVLQPQARRALVLGLSIGSWLAVLEGFPGIEAIDVVEINPGYMVLAEQFPVQARALKDPRVRLHVDDARRWLQHEPDRRYDIILMNTTWHWRANSAMLLSREMMRKIQTHLAPHGLVAFNATGSLDAFATAASVFPHVRRYENFIYASNEDVFAKTASPQAWETLREVTIDGRPGLEPDSQQVKKFSTIPFVGLNADLAGAQHPPDIITDDNMLVEYRHGRWN